MFFFQCGLFVEDEGNRVKGRRITLSDITGNTLQWKPFNGSWINGEATNFLAKKKSLAINLCHF